MIVHHLGRDYRLTPEGRIEHLVDDGWIESSHNDAPAREIPVYEAMGHPLAPLLRLKFGLNNDTPTETPA